MKYLFRIIAFLLALVTIFSICSFSAFASDDDYISTSITWWDAVIHSLIREANASNMGFVQTLVGWLSGTACTGSSDGYHHSDSIFGCKLQSDNHGTYVVTQCKYCGADFKYYSEDLKTSYYGDSSSGGSFAGRTGYIERLTEELGTTQITDDGHVICPVELVSIKCDRESGSTDPYIYNPSGSVDYSYVSFRPQDGFPSYNPNFDIYPTSAAFIGFDNFYFSYRYTVPVDGFVSYVKASASFTINYTSNDASLSKHSQRNVFDFSTYVPTGVRRTGETFTQSASVPAPYRKFYVFASCNFTYPVFEVTPFSTLLDEDLISPSTRPSSLTGDLGVKGEDGILKEALGWLFDELTNTFTNPFTGDETSIADWFFDYLDRSYHLTDENGGKITVTYGDENITVQEGDTTYNVYYITYGEVEDPCTDGKPHEWSVTDTTPATCTVAGSETQTCSKCGKTKTTALPALGHKWKVKQSVTTKYDENGELLQEGYTIYECERCGEEYKDTGSTGLPPTTPGGGSQGGDSGGGDSLWDSIVEFFKNIAASFASLPEWFSRFSDFLASAFSYLPKEIVLLLTFGVFAVVAIGIWKAVRR